MSKIRDLYEQVENSQNMLIKKKLEHLVSIKGTNEYDTSDKNLFDRDDFNILMKIVKDRGIHEGKGYLQYDQEFDYEDFTENVVIKINNQLFEFSLGSDNFFTAEALVDKADIDTNNLININIDELLQMDSKTLQEKSIIELSNELKEKRKSFMTLKLADGIRNIQDGKENTELPDSELSVYGEAEVLDSMLNSAGLKDNIDYIRKYHNVNHEIMTETNPESIYIRVGDTIIKYDEQGAKLSKETSIRSLEEFFKNEDINNIIEEERTRTTQPLSREFNEEPDESQLISLVPINLTQLGINIEDNIIGDEVSPLKKREEELSKLEKEERTISDAEKLAAKQDKDKYDIGEK